MSTEIERAASSVTFKTKGLASKPTKLSARNFNQLQSCMGSLVTFSLNAPFSNTTPQEKRTGIDSSSLSQMEKRSPLVFLFSPWDVMINIRSLFYPKK